jgi:hypothetical protein
VREFCAREAVLLDGEQVSFVRGLKGAPASIVLALVLCGRSLTKTELEVVTGYSDKPVAKGLALLELHGLAQDNGRSAGWSLRASLQLPMFPSALLGSGTGELGGRNVSDFEALSSSSGDLFGDEVDQEEEEKEATNSENFRVGEWLQRVGVGRRSPKMRALMALGLPADYVEAWCLYFQWWQREAGRRPGERVDGRERLSVGTLIRILEDGDMAPGMRCEDCLEELPCLCGVVRR